MLFLACKVAAQPPVLEINMPASTAVQEPEFPTEATLTIVLSKDRKLFYYHGLKAAGNLNRITYDSLQQFLTRKRKERERLPKTLPKSQRTLYLVVRPDDESSYFDLVDLLDAIAKAKIEHYALANMRESDKNPSDTQSTIDTVKFTERSTLTLLLSQQNKIYYFDGSNAKDVVKSIPIKELQDVLGEKKKKLLELTVASNDKDTSLHVIIKTEKNFSYSDLVNVLDEMAIANVEYTIADITQEDKKLIK